MKILIVEDDEFDCRMVKRNLKRAFPDAELHFDWVEVPVIADLCQTIDTYDVCFVDYRLGQLSGIDVIQGLCDLGAKVPFILLTGDENSELDQVALTAGAADFLHKDNLSVSSLRRSTRFCLARNEQEQRLAEMAYSDALTGLANRAAFDQRCKVLLNGRSKTSPPIALILIDLDKFKAVNDTYGHPIGDVLLRDFSRALASNFGAADMVARLGGDEFGVLLQLNDADQTPASMRKWLRSVLKTEFQIADLTLEACCSIGVNIIQPSDDAIETTDILSHADHRLYSDKRLRRLGTFNGSAQSGSLDLDLDLVVHSLESAIERGEFEVVYQPKVNCKTEDITGLEALIRWNSPNFEVGPAQFIPIAEEFGMINEIGRWVLRACCKQLKDWDTNGQVLHPVAINVSILQLEDPNFAAMVAASLAEFQIAPALVEFELTEGAFGLQLEACLNQMQSVANLGCSWAIDDFGVGYSSLSRLHKLPISKLKIDKSFLDQLPHDIAARNISNAIISMARSLSLSVVAEGVEEPGQLSGLELSELDDLQGYYCYRPMSASAVTDILTPSLDKALRA